MAPGPAPHKRYDPARYGRRWRRTSLAWLARHPWCNWPGCSAPATETDHIVPLEDGGADDESNYQSLCKGHHSAKTRRDAARRTRGGEGSQTA